MNERHPDFWGGSFDWHDRIEPDETTDEAAVRLNGRLLEIDYQNPDPLYARLLRIAQDDSELTANDMRLIQTEIIGKRGAAKKLLEQFALRSPEGGIIKLPDSLTISVVAEGDTQDEIENAQKQGLLGLAIKQNDKYAGSEVELNRKPNKGITHLGMFDSLRTSGSFVVHRIGRHAIQANIIAGEGDYEGPVTPRLKRELIIILGNLARSRTIPEPFLPDTI